MFFFSQILVLTSAKILPKVWGEIWFQYFFFNYLILLKVDPKPAVPQGPGTQNKPLVSFYLYFKTCWFMDLSLHLNISTFFNEVYVIKIMAKITEQHNFTLPRILKIFLEFLEVSHYFDNWVKYNVIRLIFMNVLLL